MEPYFEQTNVFIGGEDGVNTYRIPSLMVTSQGALLAFCEARKISKADASPTDMVLKRSEDGGRSWSAVHLAYSRGASGVSLFNYAWYRDAVPGVSGSGNHEVMKSK